MRLTEEQRSAALGEISQYVHDTAQDVDEEGRPGRPTTHGLIECVARVIEPDPAAFPVRFRGYWHDGDQDDPEIPEPWETFTVMVHGEEAADSRDLVIEDIPAMLEAIDGGQKE